MFLSQLDPVRGSIVWLFTGSDNSDADFERYVADIHLFNKTFRTHPRPVAFGAVDPGNPVPSARWRREIAEASKAVPPSTLFVMVTSSPIVRGVITALNWLREPPYETSVHATVEGATKWIDERRGQPSDDLLELLEELRHRAGS